MDQNEQNPTPPDEVRLYASDPGHPVAPVPARKRRTGWRLALLAGVLAGVSRAVLVRRRLRRARL